MTLERGTEVDGYRIEEYYWNFKPVVYVNNLLFNGTYEEAIKRIKHDKALDMQVTGATVVFALVKRLSDEGKLCHDGNIVNLLRSLSRTELNQLCSFGDVIEWRNERILKETNHD